MTLKDLTAVPEGRRAFRKATVKTRILTVAREAFIVKGINDTDLMDIAQRAGIGRATLYRYFDGKEALLAALLEEDWDKQAAYFTRLVNMSVLDTVAIEHWLYKLIRATAARLTSFPIYYAISREVGLANRLTLHRVRLMNILGKRFAGFVSATPAARVEGLLLVVQIEQAVAHAAASQDHEEVGRVVQVLASQLERLLIGETAPERVRKAI